jgi:selenocysteine-specific elongation factor
LLENIIIGTAGHVDHGKTTLIKALTGIETDTTEEEKERGLSINLGFAYFDLLRGRRAGIVDVPGHEKFIKNMMAGLAGLNLVLLVIDGGEGIMPQTREHINILQLLGIKDYIVVLTKIDTIDEEFLELVEEEIREEFKGTHLELASIIKVDSISGKGLLELKDKIDELSHSIEEKNTVLPPRMHVDRVFSKKGFGTVVTGTLIEGRIKVGDEMMVYPLEVVTKIRSIQVHGDQVAEASAGQRTALNLANMKMSEVGRGDSLAAPKTMESTWMLDVKVTVLPDAPYPIKLWDRLRLHLGTKEILCRVVPLGVDEVKVGAEGFLQLRLEEKAVAHQGDKCVLRTYSPQIVIAGAVILESNPRKHKRFNEELLEDLAIKEKGKPEDLISSFILKSPKVFTIVNEVVNYMGSETKEVEEILEKLILEGQLLRMNNLYLHKKKLDEIKERIIGQLRQYHQGYPLRKGMGKEELRSKMGLDIKGKEFDLLLHKLVEDKVICWEELVSLEDFEVIYNQEQLKEKDILEQQLKAAGFTLLSTLELVAGKEELKELIESLNGKSLIRLDGDSIIHIDYYQDAINKIQDYIQENQQITLGECRDMLGTSRKHAMAILDYTDKNKVTKRVGEARMLVSMTNPL